MFNIIKHKNIFFLISILVIIPGIFSLIFWGLRPSIDFTGGTRLTLLFPNQVNDQTVEKVQNTLKDENVEVVTVQKSEKRLIIRTKPLAEKEDQKILNQLQKEVGVFKQEELETIGPTIGQETTLNALKTIGIASLLIVIYIAWSFRNVPRPLSSWRFGVCAIVALVHDALAVVGIFSLLGHFFQVEIDSLFVTAVLTVIGFSVHDTIVVFDRIRENSRRTIGVPFPQVVNDSILQTLVRSLNTSWTALLVLLALLLFGGESIKWFVTALLIGIISGTYSSIFNAAPLLVAWQEWDERRRVKT